MVAETDSRELVGDRLREQWWARFDPSGQSWVGAPTRSTGSAARSQDLCGDLGVRMSGTSAVIGPFWGGLESRHAGRYPLSVERHAISQVARLLPGVTTVTPNARYFTLHALVADAAQRQGLVAAEAQDLLRRAEVVLAAITLRHGVHPGLSAPHGADHIRAAMSSGLLDVAQLAKPGAYAQASWGFWGPYRGSEMLLGLTSWEGSNIAPGAGLELEEVRKALGPVLDLARLDVVDTEALERHPECCMCGCADAADGRLLRALLVPTKPDPRSNGGRRSATIRLILRILQLHEVRSVTRDGWPILAYDPSLIDDPVCAALDITDAWRGVVLRNRSVLAWRDMWAELANSIAGLATIASLADVFAEALPTGTVRAYRDSLPDVGEGDIFLPAETHPGVSKRNALDRSLALLLLGGARVGRLPDRVAAYYQDPSESMQELTPSWVAERVTEWEGRSLQDFARWLVGVLVARSQRIALMKASFSRKSGTFRVPARVFVRDGLIFRDSSESGGAVSLRWDQLASVMVGAGLCSAERREGSLVWRPTERGEALLA